MAKVILSALLTSLTGKLAGSVFQQSLGGLQIRSRVSPRNPYTGNQSFNRAAFAFNASTWPSLTDVQRQSWIDNAPAAVNGMAFYVDVNQKIANTGEPLLDTYSPAPEVEGAVPAINALDATHFTVECDFADVSLQTNQWLNIFATRKLPASQTFINQSDYVYLKSYGPGNNIANPFSILPEYEALHGSIATGNQIGLYVYVINVASGTQSVGLTTRATAPL
jgi:hypothetical protein